MQSFSCIKPESSKLAPYLGTRRRLYWLFQALFVPHAVSTTISRMMSVSAYPAARSSLQRRSSRIGQ
eukprot:589527-Pyramimonas_sp.AAC.1